MKSYLSDFFNLFFPKVCLICVRALYQHEKHICKLCEKDLPRSYFHLADNNPVEKSFWGRINIEKASSFLLYTKGSAVKNILHSLKYKNNKELGFELGKMYAKDLMEINYFGSIDYIVPVPLHYKKLRVRGYNQSEWISNGLAEVMKVKVETEVLYKTDNSETQTRKGRYERWENVDNIFGITDQAIFENKSVLLVDDVLTTGATLEACAAKLSQIKNVNINVATLAYATI